MILHACQLIDHPFFRRTQIKFIQYIPEIHIRCDLRHDEFQIAFKILPVFQLGKLTELLEPLRKMCLRDR